MCSICFPLLKRSNLLCFPQSLVLSQYYCICLSQLNSFIKLSKHIGYSTFTPLSIALSRAVVNHSMAKSNIYLVHFLLNLLHFIIYWPPREHRLWLLHHLVSTPQQNASINQGLCYVFLLSVSEILSFHDGIHISACPPSHHVSFLWFGSMTL